MPPLRALPGEGEGAAAAAAVAAARRGSRWRPAWAVDRTGDCTSSLRAPRRPPPPRRSSRSCAEKARRRPARARLAAALAALAAIVSPSEPLPLDLSLASGVVDRLRVGDVVGGGPRRGRRRSRRRRRDAERPWPPTAQLASLRGPPSRRRMLIRACSVLESSRCRQLFSETQSLLQQVLIRLGHFRAVDKSDARVRDVDARPSSRRMRHGNPVYNFFEETVGAIRVGLWRRPPSVFIGVKLGGDDARASPKNRPGPAGGRRRWSRP